MHRTTLKPGIYLSPDYPEGMKGPEYVDARHSGLHVVIGENNAGKSRFMQVVAKAKRRLLVVEANRDSRPQWLTSATVTSFTLSFTAERPTHLVTNNTQMGASSITTGPPSAGFTAVRLPAELSLSADILLALGSNVPARKHRSSVTDLVERLCAQGGVQDNHSKCHVPTNRHFPQKVHSGSNGRLTEDDITGWPNLLFSLPNHTDSAKRAAYDWLQASFADITGGLTITYRGEPPNYVVTIEDKAVKLEHPLESCGDGLRDLIALLLFVGLHPNHNLFIEEPGTRLHPGAQRRLLRILQTQSANRQVWMTTHDAVFASAPTAVARYSVKRDRETKTSVVRLLTATSELRDAQLDLGWEPGDALLANTAVFCEGPSDKLLFDAILRELSETDPSYGGTIVADIGGTSAVKTGVVAKNLELLRDFAPHARQIVLLDLDGWKSTDPEPRSYELAAANAGIKLKWLGRQELEAYYLAPKVVAALLEAEAEEREVTPPGICGDLSEVEKRISSLNTEPPKRRKNCDTRPRQPSDCLEDLFQEHHLTFNKTKAATYLAMHLRTLDPDAWQELSAEIVEAYKQAELPKLPP